MVVAKTIGGRCVLLLRLPRHFWTFSQSPLPSPSSLLPSPFLFSSSPVLQLAQGRWPPLLRSPHEKNFRPSDRQSSKDMAMVGGRCLLLGSIRRLACTQLILSRPFWTSSRSPLSPLPSSSPSPFLSTSSTALQLLPGSFRSLFSSPDVKPVGRHRNKLAKSNSEFFIKWEIPWDGKTVLVTMTAFGLTFFLTNLPLTALVYALGVRDLPLLFYISQCVQCFGGTFVIMAGIRRCSPLPSNLFNYALKDPFNVSRGWLLWSMIGMFCALAAIALAGALILFINGKPFPRKDIATQLLPMIGASNPSTPLLLGGLGVLAPFWEETFFRGFLLTSLTKWMPTYAAVFLSAGAFAVGHFSPLQMPQLFAMGVVVGFAYSKTGNLLTPIVIHSLWNLSVSLIYAKLSKQGFSFEEVNRYSE